ncbi:MAG: hypothetical protein ACYCST_17990 [Acidimicrobiales bacterium]
MCLLTERLTARLLAVLLLGRVEVSGARLLAALLLCEDLLAHLISEQALGDRLSPVAVEQPGDRCLRDTEKRAAVSAPVLPFAARRRTH